jgi:hypothetical protein
MDPSNTQFGSLDEEKHQREYLFAISITYRVSFYTIQHGTVLVYA